LPFKGATNITIINSNKLDIHTNITLQAVVYAIFQKEQGRIAQELNIHGYIISVLDQTLPHAIPQKQSFSKSTAQVLDAAAIQLVWSGQTECLIHVWSYPTDGAFAALSCNDRLKAIDLLEKLEINIKNLPEPYKNNPGLIQSIKNTLFQIALLGFYSEWAGYGTSRFNRPDYRRLEYFPPGWIQTNYPGVSFGYRDFRGFLLKFPNIKGK
jgi:hypothetical protein